MRDIEGEGTVSYSKFAEPVGIAQLSAYIFEN